jgi:hypothetical protein
MTILDQMKAPTKPRDARMDQLIETTGQRLAMADTAELARCSAHEYDDEAVVPAAGSAGEQFLRSGARAFTRWISGEGRFPRTDAETRECATGWHREEAVGSQVAQAFVDLGLFYSQHVDVARGATVEHFKRVLDEVAETIAFTLLEEYGPLV